MAALIHYPILINYPILWLRSSMIHITYFANASNGESFATLYDIRVQHITFHVCTIFSQSH